VVVHTSQGFRLSVDRGPNWLFVKLRPKRKFAEDIPQIADQLWLMASRHFIYRVVLELEELSSMPPGLTAQLVLLQERLAQCGGALRICGLSQDCVDVLSARRLDAALPNHATRESAVLGNEITAFRQKIKELLEHSTIDKISEEDLAFTSARS